MATTTAQVALATEHTVHLLRHTMNLVNFMRDHRDKHWQQFRWSRMPELFLVQVHDCLEEQVAEFWHLPCQYFVTTLHDWPDGSFVEDEERQKNNGTFHKDWETMKRSGWIGDDMGNGQCLPNDFDAVPE